jgi:hypothetical protein
VRQILSYVRKSGFHGNKRDKRPKNLLNQQQQQFVLSSKNFTNGLRSRVLAAQSRTIMSMHFQNCSKWETLETGLNIFGVVAIFGRETNNLPKIPQSWTKEASII